jgi:hypothetical protein
MQVVKCKDRYDAGICATIGACVRLPVTWGFSGTYIG